jgi:epoxyqueuosine reductase
LVDARRCVSYQSIENRGIVPEEVRAGFAGRIFGCDVCQEVCPFNRRTPIEGDPRFDPRPLAGLTPVEVAGLDAEAFGRLSAGMAVARAQHDGLRRNALYAIGTSRDRQGRPVVAALADDPAPAVRDAARWALAELDARRAPPDGPSLADRAEGAIRRPGPART